jgi:phosphoserine phosphatase
VQKEPQDGRACGIAREALEREGVEVATGSPNDAIRVLVGPWERLRTDPAAKLIEAGPAESGVFADFHAAFELVALDEGGEPTQRLGPDAGLVAATSRYGGPPVWVVSGGTAAAVRAAAESLDADHLRDHYAVAIEDGKATPLPLEER